jgi:hypothetical protein
MKVCMHISLLMRLGLLSSLCDILMLGLRFCQLFIPKKKRMSYVLSSCNSHIISLIKVFLVAFFGVYERKEIMCFKDLERSLEDILA